MSITAMSIAQIHMRVNALHAAVCLLLRYKLIPDASLALGCA